MADPRSCQTRTFFLMPLALSVPIFRKNHFLLSPSFLRNLMDLFLDWVVVPSNKMTTNKED